MFWAWSSFRGRKKSKKVHKTERRALSRYKTIDKVEDGPYLEKPRQWSYAT